MAAMPTSVTDVLKNEPSRVANLLRRLHARKNEDRFTLARELRGLLLDDGGGATEARINAFISSELLIILMDIALDKKLYPHGRARWDSTMESYCVSVLGSLENFIQYLVNVRGDNLPSNQVTELLRKAPQLWDILWTKRVELFSDQAPKYDSRTNRNFPARVISLAAAFIDLHIEVHRTAPPFTEHVGHVVIYCWTFNAVKSYRHIVYGGLITLLMAHQSSVGKFMQEAVISTGIAEDFAIQCSSDLIDKDVDNNELIALLDVVGALTTHRFTLWRTLRFRRTGADSHLLRCVSIACQRQVCRGKERHVRNVLEAAFVTVQNIFAFYTLSGAFAELMCIPDTFELITFIPTMLLAAISRRDTKLIFAIAGLLTIYDEISVIFKDCKLAAIWYDPLRQTMGKVWLPTLRDLRKLNIDPNDVCYKAVKSWIEVGNTFGFDESDPNSEPEDITNRGRPGNPYSCHWRDCLCYNRENKIHEMRVCKGCLKVAYCSWKCQTRDWEEGGHRALCLQYQARHRA